MPKVSYVELDLQGEDLNTVNVKVTFTLEFSNEELAENQRYRVTVQLYGDDKGEDRPFFSLSPLYTFSFGLFGNDFTVVTANSIRDSWTVRAIVGRSILDEDPGTIRKVIGRQGEGGQPVILEIPKPDEVYALVTLTTDVIATGQSATQRAPQHLIFG